MARLDSSRVPQRVSPPRGDRFKGSQSRGEACEKHKRNWQGVESPGMDGGYFFGVVVACQRYGTTLLTGAWGHLDVSPSIADLAFGVKGDARSLPV